MNYRCIFTNTKLHIMKIRHCFILLCVLTGCGITSYTPDSNFEYSSLEHATNSPLLKNNISKTDTEYVAYNQVIHELESYYGLANIEFALSGAAAIETVFLTGCYFRLVDFDEDGVYELLAICYSPKTPHTPYANNYLISIYSYDEDKANLIFIHQGLSGFDYDNMNEIMPYITLIHDAEETQLLLPNTEKSLRNQYLLYGKRGNTFTVVSHFFDEKFHYILNSSNSSNTKYYAWGNDKTSLNQLIEETNDTKKFLNDK